VEFKAGGVTGRHHEDSFEVGLGSVSLTADWRQYSISLQGASLANVIGGFAWVATSASNPGGVTFYLDAIRYERQ